MFVGRRYCALMSWQHHRMIHSYTSLLARCVRTLSGRTGAIACAVHSMSVTHELFDVCVALSLLNLSPFYSKRPFSMRKNGCSTGLHGATWGTYPTPWETQWGPMVPMGDPMVSHGVVIRPHVAPWDLMGYLSHPMGAHMVPHGVLIRPHGRPHGAS